MPKNKQNGKFSYKRKCPVLGCDSVTTDDLKFFRFPESKKESTKSWCIFTKVKNFKPIPTEVMCELHFSAEAIAQNKNGKKYVKKNSVPTIFYLNGQKIVVPYDNSLHQYYGYEAELMTQEMEGTFFDKEKELTNLRYEKVQKIKSLCRLCFSNDKDTKCIALSKLQAYSIDPEEMIQAIGISKQYSEAFNEIICLDCFDRLIDFSEYRQKCQKAQNELILSMQELDRKILEIQQSQRCQNTTFKEWVKVEVTQDNTVYEEDFYDNTTMDSNEEDSSYGNQQLDFSCLKVKNEPEVELFDEVVPEKKRKLNSTDEQSTEHSKKPSLAPSTSNNVEDKKKLKAPINTKMSFQCFFCRKKFDKKAIYTSHKCEVRRVKCEVDGCDSYFTNQGGYNVHIQRRHQLPKVSKHSCPACKTYYQMSAAQFDEHCKQCRIQNKYKERNIKCEKCKKIFTTLPQFTAHRMFHDAEDLMKNKQQPVNKSNNLDKNTSTDICDLCGKVFINSAGALRRHKINVHFTEFTGNLFFCDLCPIAKPTKALIYSHMKSTHIIRWHSCEICGKVFKNRECWRKHQLVHGDSKKNHLCEVCPHQPGFVTASGLKSHMTRHHGGNLPVRKFLCNVPNCKAAYSRDDQLTRHRVNVHRIYHNNYNEDIIRHYIGN